MAENGTATFASPDDYQAGIGGVSSKGTRVNFIVTGGGDFKARLTWLKLRRVRVLRGSENLPSIAYVSLPPERVVVLFPTSTATLIWGDSNCGLAISSCIAAVSGRINGPPEKVTGVLSHCRPNSCPPARWP